MQRSTYRRGQFDGVQTRQKIDPRRVRVRCESEKSTFLTEGDARTSIERMMDAGQVQPGCHLFPYLHNDGDDACGWWHVRNRRVVFPKD